MTMRTGFGARTTCAISAPVNTIATCSDANAAIDWRPPLSTGEARNRLRSSSSAWWRADTPVSGSPWKSCGAA
jgi:hypothetical protein